VLGIGKVRPHHEEHVDLVHQVLGRLGAEQPDPAGGIRRVVGDRRLARQRLDDLGAKRLSDGEQFLPGMQRPGAGQDRDLAPVVEEIGEPLQVFRRWQAGWRQVDGRGLRGAGRATRCLGSAAASATWMSLGTVMCATPRRA
jgi:hypothetical protein